MIEIVKFIVYVALIILSKREEIRKFDDNWKALLNEIRDNREEMRMALNINANKSK